MPGLEQVSDTKRLGLFQEGCHGRSKSGNQNATKNQQEAAEPDAPYLIIA